MSIKSLRFGREFGAGLVFARKIRKLASNQFPNIPPLDPLPGKGGGGKRAVCGKLVELRLLREIWLAAGLWIDSLGQYVYYGGQVATGS